jgi:predicted transposase YbfD/YdcC
MKLRPKYRLVEHFAEIDDPRIERTKRHKLIDILTIAILAVICGAEGWVAMESFGKAKHQWLKKILELPNGIPSDDTFARVFASLNPEQFQDCFLHWVKSIAEVSEGEVIAIDGKTLRHSYDNANGKGAIQMVSAWATANRLVLGQCKVESKSNEITAIPKLLKMLEVKGCIVTIDAMGTQTKIAQQIVGRGGDYVLALKGNQGNLCEDVEQLFAHAQSVNFAGIKHDFHQTIDKGHGRIEIRRCWTMEQTEFLLGAEKWAKLTSICMIKAERRLKDNRSYALTETLLYDR